MRSVCEMNGNADKVYRLSRTRLVGPNGSWEPKAIVEFGATHSQYYNLTRGGFIKYMGWLYDFRDELKKYIVKDGYGNLSEMYAPNKTSIRKGYGSAIEYIIEIKNPYFKKVK